MAVTIKDVAAAAGVSPSTVSRTCKDSPSISRDTKERVRRIMAQLGYEPNFEAEPVEAFSKTIGIILPSSQRDVYENAFHLEIIRGIGQFCNQRRYVNTVITGQDDAEVLDAIQSMVANAQADGFILLYSKKDCPVAAYLRNEGLLHVIVGKAAQSANQTIYIDNDNALAGEEAADYLYEMGHRRIAYFGVSNAMLFSAERKRGYQMSLLKLGITPREEDCVEVNTLNDAYEGALKALLTAPNHPTAMLVSDDILAVVLEQFCGKLGLRVPKDLSIVSFNNSLFSRITSPQLTTVDVNPYQLGMEAASQTINHIENPNLLATKIIVPHKLIPRESCCPAMNRRQSRRRQTSTTLKPSPPNAPWGTKSKTCSIRPMQHRKSSPVRHSKIDSAAERRKAACCSVISTLHSKPCATRWPLSFSVWRCKAMLPARTAQKPLRLSAPYGQHSLSAVPAVPCWFTGPVPPCRCGCPPSSVPWAWPCR